MFIFGQFKAKNGDMVVCPIANNRVFSKRDPKLNAINNAFNVSLGFFDIKKLGDVKCITGRSGGRIYGVKMSGIFSKDYTARVKEIEKGGTVKVRFPKLVYVPVRLLIAVMMVDLLY